MPSHPQFDDLSAAAKRVFNRYGTHGFDALTDPEQILVIVWGLGGEVNNGGFDQWLYNSSGDLAKRAPDALRAIGANPVAEMIEHANSVFGPDGPPEDFDARRVVMEKDDFDESDVLGRIDDAFYKYDGQVRGKHDTDSHLDNLLFAYAQRVGLLNQSDQTPA